MPLTRHTIASNFSRDGCGHDGLPFPLYVFLSPLSVFSTSFLDLSSATTAVAYVHPEPPWAGSRFPLGPGTSRYRVISVSFYCVPPSPGLHLVPEGFFCSFGRHVQLHLGTLPLGPCSLERLQSTMPHAGASEPSYQNPHRSNQLWKGFCVDPALYLST